MIFWIVKSTGLPLIGFKKYWKRTVFQRKPRKQDVAETLITEPSIESGLAVALLSVLFIGWLRNRE